MTGCCVLITWLWSATGFVLSWTGVAPGAVNMGVGVGLCAVLLTVLWFLDR